MGESIYMPGIHQRFDDYDFYVPLMIGQTRDMRREVPYYNGIKGEFEIIGDADLPPYIAPGYGMGRKGHP